MWQRLFILLVILPGAVLIGIWAYLRTWGRTTLGNVAREKRLLRERRQMRTAIQNLYQGQTIVARDATGSQKEVLVVAVNPRREELTVLDDHEETIPFSDVVEIL